MCRKNVTVRKLDFDYLFQFLSKQRNMATLNPSLFTPNSIFLHTYFKIVAIITIFVRCVCNMFGAIYIIQIINNAVYKWKRRAQFCVPVIWDLDFRSEFIGSFYQMVNKVIFIQASPSNDLISLCYNVVIECDFGFTSFEYFIAIK